MLSPVPHEALRSKSGFPDGMNQIPFAYILGYSKTWEMPEICRELYKKYENKKSSMLKGCISSMAVDFIGKQEIQASREHATSYIMWLYKPRKRGSHRKHAGKQMSQFVLFDQLCVVLTLFWTLFQYRINIYTVENFQTYQFNTGVTWRLSLRIWLFFFFC